ncbi:MAG TPA: CoA-binding protein [Bacteroidales bacterium]|nr:CoA-binding protein [Bacteroidales bacterium]HRZ49444.1 CoA-binding protein [Bacteroidales bacterium]
MASEKPIIDQILQQKHVAVAGVSRNKSKFGYIVFDHLKKSGYTVYPINPNVDEIADTRCYRDISSLPDTVTALVTVTKPEVTESLVKEAGAKGIGLVWMQQGSQNEAALKAAEEAGISVVQKRCIMMFAEPVKSVHGFHRAILKFFGKYPK